MIRVVRLDHGQRPEINPGSPLFADSEPTQRLLASYGFASSLASDELPDYGTLVLAPPSALTDLVAVVDRLLGPGGCPWDQAQTHESLKPYLIEEAYEVLDAIDRGDVRDLKEELGDVLLQPVLHGQISSLAGGFSTEEIARTLVDKLIRRHPHVFGDAEARTPEQVLVHWDAIKRQEKPDTSILSGIPMGMPALMRAQKVSKRAAKAGFEWPDLDAVLDKVIEEISEIRRAESPEEQSAEFGDLLFTLVNVARWLGIDSEASLRTMVTRFETRFRAMEEATSKPLTELTLAEWDDLWVAAKAKTASAS
jgi:MazG family protein